MTTYRDESGPGDTTAWVYDPATGLLVQKLYDDGKGPTYTYTPDGKLATRTWARGVTTTYAYDGWGNLTNIVHSDGTPSVSMAYDVMGRQIQTSDAAGVTAFAYDAFSSLTNETVAGQYAKALDRYYDECGRNVGYSLDGQRKQTVAYDPATGRVATMDGFAWQYLPGTDLKQSLAYPGGAVAEWVYEPRRDLLTLVSNDVFSAYAYENDAAGRRIAKNTERYGYNVRGELIAATNTAPVAHYAYTFDDIGNRIVADELGTNIAYTANALNQYTNIVAEAAFTPVFDADGNQTLVKTSTGIWHVAYNAENRPVVWSNEAAVVTMDFDRMGRRVGYKSISGGQTNAFSKFVYDGYLCVQRLDGFTGEVEQEYAWDPTETVATRPLKWTLTDLGRTFCYFHDGNKNISELIDADSATLAAHYDYAPFGAVTVATGPMADANPYRFSSEYHDDALGCVYYNYRHYNPLDGRWINRDPIGERGGVAIYSAANNSLLNKWDFLGKAPQWIWNGSSVTLDENGNLTIQTSPDVDYGDIDRPTPPPPSGGPGLFENVDLGPLGVGPFTPPCCSSSECLQWIADRRNTRLKNGTGFCALGCMAGCSFTSGAFWPCFALCSGKCEAFVAAATAAAYGIAIPICLMCEEP